MPLDRSRIRAICFDVDGTLRDTDDQYVAILARWLQPLAWLLPEGDPARLARRLVLASESPGAHLRYIPDWLGLDAPLAALNDWAARRFFPRRAYLLIGGVAELLAQLSRHYPLAIVSGRSRWETENFLRQSGLGGFFRCVTSAQTCRHSKPYPDPVLWAAGQMGVLPRECLMVGDTTVDIVAGKSAGAQTVAVLCGFGEGAELQRAGADLLLLTTADLINYLDLTKSQA
jgi:HAD superfamily hydrolase (TIGR01509 family)